MRKELERHGREWAEEYLRDAFHGSGTCESCGVFGAVYFTGVGGECRQCTADTVVYWERREGCSSEHVFCNYPHMPAESSRVYRVAMGAYFAHLRGGDNDGNPFSESDPYCDPCLRVAGCGCGCEDGGE
jgi:hypothetical protein